MFQHSAELVMNLPAHTVHPLVVVEMIPSG